MWGHPQLLQAINNEMVLTSTPDSTTVLDVVLQLGSSLLGDDLDWTLQTVVPRTVLQEDVVPTVSMAWHINLQVVAEPDWKPDRVRIDLDHPLMFRQFLTPSERLPGNPERHGVQGVCHGPFGNLRGAYGPSGRVQG